MTRWLILRVITNPVIALFLPGTRYFGRLVYWGVYHRGVPEALPTTFDQLSGNPGACSRVWVVRDLIWWLALEDQQRDAENLRRLEETHAVADKHGYYKAEVTLYVRARKNLGFGANP